MTRNHASRTFLVLKDAQRPSERCEGSFDKIGRVVIPGRTAPRQELRHEHCISGLRSFIKKGQKKSWFCHVFAVEDDAGVCAVTEQFSVSRCDERRQRYGATQWGGAGTVGGAVRNRKSQFLLDFKVFVLFGISTKRATLWTTPQSCFFLKKKCQSSLSGLHSFFSGDNFRPVAHYGKHRMCPKINLALVLLVTKLTKPSVWTQFFESRRNRKFRLFFY